MAIHFKAILTCLLVTALSVLMALGSLNSACEGHGASHSHSHTHAHSHAEVTHNHVPHGCGTTHSAHTDGHGDTEISGVSALSDHDHCCCHCDHTYLATAYVVPEWLRWQDNLSSGPCPLPDLWQPAASTSPPAPPIPPPPRCEPSESLHQLRTVVLLT